MKPTALQAPNQNAFVERREKSIKFECPNFFAVFGKKHFDYIISSYETYYNTVMPHQALDNRSLTGKWPAVDDPLFVGEKSVCHEKLGGLLRHYERVAE